MKELTRKVLVATLGATLAIGCNAGSQVSSGMSEQDAKDAIARMSPEQKIKAIASSPMPQQEKDKKYAEIEAETGVKAKDILGGAPKPGGN